MARIEDFASFKSELLGGLRRSQSPRLNFFAWLRSPIKLFLPHLKKGLVTAMSWVRAPVKPKTTKLVFFASPLSTQLDFYSSSSLKIQSAGRYSETIGICAVYLESCEEETNTDLIVWFLPIYCNWSKHDNHYTTEYESGIKSCSLNTCGLLIRVKMIWNVSVIIVKGGI